MKTIASGVDHAGTPLRLGHIAIRTEHPVESMQFYERVFGYGLNDKHEDAEGRFSIYFLGGQPPHHVIELVWNWDEVEIAAGRQLSHIAFAVQDLRKTAAIAMDNHGSMLEEPHVKAKGHWRCYIGDPNGMAIELNQLD